VTGEESTVQRGESRKRYHREGGCGKNHLPIVNQPAISMNTVEGKGENEINTEVVVAAVRDGNRL